MNRICVSIYTRFDLRHQISGQASVEYVVGIAAAVIILVVADSGNPSVITQLVTTLKSFWTNYSYIISMP